METDVRKTRLCRTAATIMNADWLQVDWWTSKIEIDPINNNNNNKHDNVYGAVIMAEPLR